MNNCFRFFHILVVFSLKLTSIIFPLFHSLSYTHLGSALHHVFFGVMAVSWNTTLLYSVSDINPLVKYCSFLQNAVIYLFSSGKFEMRVKRKYCVDFMLIELMIKVLRFLASAILNKNHYNHRRECNEQFWSAAFPDIYYLLNCKGFFPNYYSAVAIFIWPVLHMHWIIAFNCMSANCLLCSTLHPFSHTAKWVNEAKRTEKLWHQNSVTKVTVLWPWEQIKRVSLLSLKSLVLQFAALLQWKFTG